MSIAPRYRRAARAAFIGWIAGCAALLPVQIYEAVRNAGFGAGMGVPRFAELLALSIAMWMLLTFGLACYFCCVVVFPAVWILLSVTIVEHRVLWVASNMIFGIALMALRAHVWTAIARDGVGFANFWLWGAFAGIFFAVAAEIYWRELRKAMTA